MNLEKFIGQLQKLVDEGHANKQVFYRHGASSDCGPVGSARITSEVDDCGPFDLDDGEEYVSIYVGN